MRNGVNTEKPKLTDEELERLVRFFEILIEIEAKNP